MNLLSDLAADQPAQPVDRLGSVKGRARRIRRQRYAAAGTALALAASAPLALLSRTGNDDSAPASFASQRVTSWPDRTAPADRHLGDGMLGSLADRGIGVLSPAPLWQGTVETPAEDFAVAVLTGTVDGQRMLLVGHAERDKVDEEGRSADGTNAAWDTEQVPLVDQTSISTYLPYVGDNQLRAVVLALGAPGSTATTWSQRPLPYAPTDGVRLGGAAQSDDGVFRIDAGPVVGDVEVGGETAVGDAPLLPAVAPAPDAGQVVSAGVGSDLDRDPDLVWGSTLSLSVPDDAGPQQLRLRCYGGGTLAIRLVEARPRAGEPRPTTSESEATCNGIVSISFTDMTPEQINGSTLTLSSDRPAGFSANWLGVDPNP